MEIAGVVVVVMEVAAVELTANDVVVLMYAAVFVAVSSVVSVAHLLT